MPSTAILWFRRDLRLHDHPALTRALADHARVVPVFVLDDRLVGGRYASGPRTIFMLGCLRELDAGLRELGSGLVIRHGRPEDELAALAQECDAAAVYWTSDVAPFARTRDTAVTAALQDAGVEAIPQGGTYIVDVNKPQTGKGHPYVVFSPFHRAWQQMERRTVHRAPPQLPALPAKVAKGRLPGADALQLDDAGVDLFREPGEAAARRALAAWLDGPIDRYQDRHNDLATGSDPGAGTSGLSPYLRWGSLSPLECEQRADRRGGAGAAAWSRQLAWRDFYAHVLLKFPDNLHREYQERYRTLSWASDDEGLEAWQDGQTGYPLVDAAMRQLAQTGWMHNRARMVVGSFLTKDLHLDWRAGEEHFARLLLDGEPAQNNGNWQWIASTGVDPKPYFQRLFNPILQQRKFDPEGIYVRRWVPELAGVPDARLPEPWTMSEAEQRAAGCVIGTDYPAPIVDHFEERERAKERYRQSG